jgi:hypothetical protein
MEWTGQLFGLRLLETTRTRHHPEVNVRSPIQGPVPRCGAGPVLYGGDGGRTGACRQGPLSSLMVVIRRSHPQASSRSMHAVTIRLRRESPQCILKGRFGSPGGSTEATRARRRSTRPHRESGCWHRAGTLEYRTRDIGDFDLKDRWEFVGTVATEIRDEYVGKFVGKARGNPVRYVNC